MRKNSEQHATTQTDATCTIQHCWELLAKNVASVCTAGLKNNNFCPKILIIAQLQLSYTDDFYAPKIFVSTWSKSYTVLQKTVHVCFTDMSRENDFPRQLEFYCQARTGIKKKFFVWTYLICIFCAHVWKWQAAFYLFYSGLRILYFSFQHLWRVICDFVLHNMVSKNWNIRISW